VEDWLRSIGLAERAVAFREQGIALDQVTDLTEQDLRDLGLTIGERRRFQRAVNAMRTAGAQPLPTTAPQTQQGERRPLTVMFIDLVGSTAIGEQLDPEDLLELTRRYRDLCGAAIVRYGGYPARAAGDGVLAYFCYPVANENDPERAVRAALEITANIGSIATPNGAQLQVRIGMATGRAVVADLDAGGLDDRDGVTGSLPNLAARLNPLAPANGVIIAESTHARVAARFLCEPLGLVELRGFSALHQPWQVIGEHPHGAIAAPTTPLHGREAELAALHALWRRAARGEGQVALVMGEPGIGKSRLVDEIARLDPPEGAHVVRLAADAFDQDSPLRPLADHLRFAAGIRSDEDAATGLGKLAAILHGDAQQKQLAAAAFAGLLGLGPGEADARKTPAQVRQDTIAVVVEQTMAAALEQPLLLVIEDLHWLDPSTRELLQIVIGRIAGSRILILLTARDSFTADWIDDRNTTVLRLQRLGREHVAAIVRDYFAGQPVSDRLVDHVVTKTEGVPLFVEEMARLLLDRPEIAERDGTAHADLEGAIPASLQETLTARLDRSGLAKEVAQIAAVLGRSVPIDVLAAVCGKSAAALETPLTTLVQAGVLERHRSGRDVFTFSHVLLRDAAYATLLRDRRRTLHARVAAVLEERDPDEIARNPDVLALHLTEAGLADRAAPYWMGAARLSLVRSALTEATRTLRRALLALERLPDTEANRRLRVQVSALLGPAMIGLHGPNAPETRALYTTAYDLARQLPDDPSHFPIYWGWWRISLDTTISQEEDRAGVALSVEAGTGSASSALERASVLMAVAERSRDPGLLLQAHHCCWASHLHVGNFQRVCEHVEAGLAVYSEVDHTQHAGLYGNHDAKVCAHGGLSQLLWMQGRFAEGIRHEEQSLHWARRIDHLGSRVHALGLTLLHCVYRRDFDEVFARAAELIALTAEHGVADHGAAGLIFQGWVIAARGDAAAGLRLLEEGLERQRNVATLEDFPVYLCLLTEVLTTLGRADAAVERILHWLPEFERIGLRMWIPELLRVLADAMLAASSTDPATAAAHLAEAAALADRQHVPMLGLRIAVSAARRDLRLDAPERAARRLRVALDAMPAGEIPPVEVAEARRLHDQIVQRESSVQ
jgi:class 3 adenylate cyclase/predicted ATPase